MCEFDELFKTNLQESLKALGALEIVMSEEGSPHRPHARYSVAESDIAQLLIVESDAFLAARTWTADKIEAELRSYGALTPLLDEACYIVRPNGSREFSLDTAVRMELGFR